MSAGTGAVSAGHAEQAWSSDDVRPPDGEAWDLVVVGGGTAGIVAARTAAELGAGVLLLEQARTGGDCLWTGCVPSKALLSVAHEVARLRAGSPRAGVPGTDPAVDWTAVRESVRRAVAQVEPDDAPDTLRAAGVRVARGRAELTGPARLEVAGTQVGFRALVLATGSAPVVPDDLVPGPGALPAAVLTSETVWDLQRLPRRLVVLGAGSIGCELGQAFARLGSRVTLVEREARVLPAEDPDASAVLADALRADGVDLRLGRTASVEGQTLRLDDGTVLATDAVLVALGRQARTDGLGLDAAGVALDAQGCVAVDARLATGNPRVWAAGDVTAYPRFTHVAGLHGSTAATNAVLGLRRSASTLVPRVTYTSPEIASFGSRDAPARTVWNTDVDRAVAEARTEGFSRLHGDRRGRLAGATVVGERAGEVLAELVLAAHTATSLRTLAGTVHAYPTWGYAAWDAALGQVHEDLRRPVVRRVLGLLRAVRRRRTDRGRALPTPPP